MILISGIGNKEMKYHNTRHNVGYLAIDVLRQALRFEGFIAHKALKYNKYYQSDLAPVRWGLDQVIVLQKTKTNMNNAGVPVKKVYEKEEADELVLFHDDLDIKLGEYKIQKGKSPKGHNGVKSVEKELGFTDFWRVRIGIENRENKEIPGEEYVLQRFTKEEQEIVGATLVMACEELLFTELFEEWM
jgi:peptidyl-tRNA hydrolase, PTH1 family